MAKYTILPTTNLKAEDVRDTVGGSNNLTSFFTASLNETSKYKPVRYPANFVDDNNRWKGVDGNCGFTFPNSSNYSTVPSWYASDGSVGMNGWVYNKPRGVYDSVNEPMRLGDFRGYCTTVIPMSQSFYCPESGQMTTGAILRCTCMLSNPSDTNLAITDLATLATSYFGVYAVNVANTSNTRIAFSQTKGSATVDLPCHDMTLGDWKIYPFFASASSHSSGTKYYPVPYVGYRKVTMKSSIDAITMRIGGELSADKSTCTWKVYAVNKGGTTTVSTNAVYYKFFGNNLSTALQTGEKSTSVNSVSVPSSTTEVVIASGTFTNTASLASANGMLWFSFGGGKYTGSVSPIAGAGDRT